IRGGQILRIVPARPTPAPRRETPRAGSRLARSGLHRRVVVAQSEHALGATPIRTVAPAHCRISATPPHAPYGAAPTANRFQRSRGLTTAPAPRRSTCV